MSEEKYNEGEIREGELSDLPEDSFGKREAGETMDKQALYRKEQRNVERGIEMSGEKLGNNLPTDDMVGEDEDEDEGQDGDSIDSHAREIIRLDADEQVSYLVKIATRKNPYLAIDIAKHLQNNYVLAELHSDLTEEKVRNILLEKGLL